MFSTYERARDHMGETTGNVLYGFSLSTKYKVKHPVFGVRMELEIFNTLHNRHSCRY